MARSSTSYFKIDPHADVLENAYMPSTTFNLQFSFHPFIRFFHYDERDNDQIMTQMVEVPVEGPANMDHFPLPCDFTDEEARLALSSWLRKRQVTPDCIDPLMNELLACCRCYVRAGDYGPESSRLVSMRIDVKKVCECSYLHGLARLGGDFERIAERTKEEDCSICMEDFDWLSSVVLLPCLHLFHRDCIGPWLHQNRTCPLCRRELHVKIF
ncbi:hypothetical protein Droror1_Dr00021647 [Drosera rotundifolia]